MVMFTWLHRLNMRETADRFESIGDGVLPEPSTSSPVLLEDASNLPLNEHHNTVMPRYSALIASNPPRRTMILVAALRCI